MTTVQQHYDHHLGPIYNWMIGDFEAALQHQRDFLRDIALPPGGGQLAVDLGAGSGLQSLPLAELGYEVLAIDSCQTLLKDLAQVAGRAGLTHIRTLQDDLTHFRRQVNEASVVACVGDTLPHLPSRTAVTALLRDVAAALVKEGTFIVSFRDTASTELIGAQRFIPVRSDERRTLTCFLEYFPDYVQVHDLVQQLDAGRWRLSVSSYRKLRLSKQWLLQELERVGLRCDFERVENGMVRLAARKTAN